MRAGALCASSRHLGPRPRRPGAFLEPRAAFWQEPLCSACPRLRAQRERCSPVRWRATTGDIPRQSEDWRATSTDGCESALRTPSFPPLRQSVRAAGRATAAAVRRSSQRWPGERVATRLATCARALTEDAARPAGGEEGRLRATTTCLLMFLCATGKAREICAARGEKPRSSQPVYRAVAVPRAGVEKG